MFLTYTHGINTNMYHWQFQLLTQVTQQQQIYIILPNNKKTGKRIFSPLDNWEIEKIRFLISAFHLYTSWNT